MLAGWSCGLELRAGVAGWSGGLELQAGVTGWCCKLGLRLDHNFYRGERCVEAVNRRRLPAAPRLDVSSALATSGSGCCGCTVGDGADRASNWDIGVVCGRGVVEGSH